MQKSTKQILLNISPELSEKLNEMAEEMHISKSDVLRKAIF